MSGQGKYATLAGAALVTVLLLAWPADLFAQGCAMCATYLSGANDPLTKAFNRSIFLLLITPYALFASIGGWIGYTYWRASRAQRTTPQIIPFAAADKETVQ